MLCDYPLDASDIFGGTSAAAYNLVEALLKYTNININTYSFNPDIKSTQSYHKENNRLKIFRFPAKFKYRNLINFADIRYNFKKFLNKEKVDIIHAQGEDLYSILAVDSGLPNVFTIHGIRLKEIEIEIEKTGLIRYFFRKRAINSIHKKASNIIAINEYTKSQIPHFSNARVWIVKNAIAEKYFNLYREEHPKTGHILLAGGIRKRKDIITALKAIKNIINENIDVILHITGPIEPEYSVEVNVLINNYNLKNNVIIHGLVHEEELMNLYKEADLYLLTSIEESSPISIVEAMAVGKPIVATNVGGIKEMVEEGGNAFLTEVKNDKEIAKSIKKVVTNRNLRNDFSAKSHDIASNNWSSKAVALDTYKIYKEILHAK